MRWWVIAVLCVGCRLGKDEKPWELARGREFDHRPVALVTRGETDGPRLRELFGEPFSVTKRPEGGERWEYLAEFARSREHMMFNKAGETFEVKVKSYVVELDAKGVVARSHFSEDTVKREME